ncbi:YqaJ viral recombinase family protein [Rhodococcus qingshengii]|uniref:YqaJ viral recombinase family protein n=1 Tax=Rhodococcus qingshengii TaxID=334542 RepID=A0AAW6LSL1_RHOSG|nr:YqaJ viral recombinase family protein [Rhodococcus qingshengii]MDE8648162.1 YqaJ viral recombinase family protein [Rhodococcus qingshengii]
MTNATLPKMLPGDIINDSAVVIGSFESGSDEWHEARANGIGGSEIPSIVGLNQWESYFSTYYRKLNKLRPVEESDPMKWGTLIEPVIYDEYRKNHLRPGLRMTTGDTFHHIERPWQIANPDGLMWDADGNLVDLLEIKTAGVAEKWGPSGTDLIPINYRCQMAWYMDVLGLRSGVLRVLIGSSDPRTYRITPTQEDFEFLRNSGAEFMHALKNGIEPNLDSHMATYQAQREMHPLIDDTVVQINTDLADRWWASADKLKAAEEEHLGVKIEIADKMGLAKMAMCGDEKIAYRQRPARGGDPFVKSAIRPKFQDRIAPVAA